MTNETTPATGTNETTPTTGTNETISPPCDTVDMICACGADLSFDRSAERVTCQCGASYAVTITQLTQPDGGGG